MKRLGLVAAGTLLVTVMAGCGPSSQSTTRQNAATSQPAAPGHPGSPAGRGQPATAAASPAANRQAAQAEAARLLGLVTLPPGASRISSLPTGVLPGPVLGLPITSQLVDDHTFWRVPLSADAGLAWFANHPPDGLVLSGSATSPSGEDTAGRGYSYGAPSTAAWTDASAAIGVASMGPTESVVRVDGVAVWINPVPIPDATTGSRMRLTLSSGCPLSDKGFVGVTNPPPALDRSLLPSGTPTAGLICAYYGMNGHPFALQRKTALSAVGAAAFASKAGQLSLGHVDATTECPMDDGSASVVTLAYPNGRDIDLWMATNGCATTSNGAISASGDVTN